MANIPKPIGRFETTLASKITSTDTSMTLSLGTDAAGTTLAGIIGFTVDEGTTNEEFIIGTATGTSIASLLRGISVSDGKTEVTALKKAHRKGATVKVTDFPLIGEIYNLLYGTDGFPNKLSYASHPTFTADESLIDKKYADDLSYAGAPDMSLIAKGVGEEATAADIDAGTQTGSTSAELVVNPKYLKDSIYKSQLPSANEKAAIAGNSGTAVSASNKLVDAADVDTAATASKIVRRIAGGQTTVAATPSAATDAASKGYVDGNPITWKCDHGSYDMSTASGNVVIAHGLGRVPKFLQLQAIKAPDTSTNAAATSTGFYNGTTMACVYRRFAGDGDTDSYILWIDPDGTNYVYATVTMDATNITLAFTKANSATGYLHFIWSVT